MTWFKVDDTAYGHPKVLKAGNAALGLWVKGGAYAAQHLTEGTVPGVVAQLYGTAPRPASWSRPASGTSTATPARTRSAHSPPPATTTCTTS